MSGGHFDYQQHRIGDIADEIDSLIASNDDDSDNGFGGTVGNHYPNEVIERFKTASRTLRLAQEMAHRVDWLVSSDDSEESFLQRWDTEIAKINEGQCT